MEMENILFDYIVPDFKEVSEEAGKKKRAGVLCTIEGPFMEVEAINQNDRFYTRSLIENKIVNAPFTKTMMANRTLYGEGRHPTDRFEVWCPEATHNVTDLWFSDDGKYLMGRADILDTFVGNTIYKLFLYGSKLGISARAAGKTKKTSKGLEVIEDTYTFKGFDFVTNPGFGSARTAPVNESVSEGSSFVLDENCINMQESLYNNMKSLIEDSNDFVALTGMKTLLESVEDDKFDDLLGEVGMKLDSFQFINKNESTGNGDLPIDRVSELEEGTGTEEAEKVDPTVITDTVLPTEDTVEEVTKEEVPETQTESLTEQTNIAWADPLIEENFSMSLQIDSLTDQNYDLQERVRLLESRESQLLLENKKLTKSTYGYSNIISNKNGLLESLQIEEAFKDLQHRQEIQMLKESIQDEHSREMLELTESLLEELNTIKAENQALLESLEDVCGLVDSVNEEATLKVETAKALVEEVKKDIEEVPVTETLEVPIYESVVDFAKPISIVGEPRAANRLSQLFINTKNK